MGIENAQYSTFRQFYNRQIEYLETKDVEGLIENQYTDDAYLLGFDLMVSGKQALVEHFHEYLEHLGYLKVLSTDKFAETDDAIFFEATVETAGGIANVYDVFIMRDGKIAKHFTGLSKFTPNGQS